LANLRWGLIAFLGAVALVRPLLSIAGAYDFLGGATGRVVVTILIAAVWIGAVVILRVPRPLLTLAAAGAAYGLFTIFLQQVMWNLVLGEVPAEAPDSTPIFGGLLGRHPLNQHDLWRQPCPRGDRVRPPASGQRFPKRHRGVGGGGGGSS
jgi:hypothetical protein